MPRPGDAEEIVPVDPFDLPDWLGESEVTWTAVSSLGGHHVAGRLDDALGGLVEGPGPEDGRPPRSCGCDLLAADLAYPEPVMAERWRSLVHQAWWRGEALLVKLNGRLTVVMPGTEVTAEPALEAVRRLAKAVGAPSDRFTVALRL